MPSDPTWFLEDHIHFSYIKESKCWVCPLCQSIFTQKIDMKKHNRKQCCKMRDLQLQAPSGQSDRNSGFMSCQHCGQTFRRLSGLDRHVQLMHGPKMPDLGAPFEPSRDERESTDLSMEGDNTSGTEKTQVNDPHNSIVIKGNHPNSQNKEKECDPSDKIQWSEADNAWICSLCNKIMRSKAAFRKHRMKEDCQHQQPENPSWQNGWNRTTMGCRYCGQTFSRRRGIRLHLQKKLCPKLPDWDKVFGREIKPSIPKNQGKNKKQKGKKGGKGTPAPKVQDSPQSEEESDSPDEDDSEEEWVQGLDIGQPAHGPWRESQQIPQLQDLTGPSAGSSRMDQHLTGPSAGSSRMDQHFTGPSAGSSRMDQHFTGQAAGSSQRNQSQTSCQDRRPPQFPGHDWQNLYTQQARAHMPDRRSEENPDGNARQAACDAAFRTGWPKRDGIHRDGANQVWPEEGPQQRCRSEYPRDQYDRYYGQGDGSYNHTDRPSQRERDYPRNTSRRADYYQEGSSQRSHPDRSHSPIREIRRETDNIRNRDSGYKTYRTRYFYPTQSGTKQHQGPDHHEDNYRNRTQDSGWYRGSHDRGDYHGYPEDRGNHRYRY